jgi:flagellar hook-basal body complex protein FliE
MTSIDSSRLMQMRTAILEQNSALQRAAGAGPAGVAGMNETQGATPAGFGDAFRNALGEVNSMQAQSSAMSEAYEKGEVTDIAAVMLSRQQASIGFEATLQVRNKLLSAYKDIMSMPV